MGERLGSFSNPHATSPRTATRIGISRAYTHSGDWWGLRETTRDETPPGSDPVTADAPEKLAVELNVVLRQYAAYDMDFRNRLVVIFADDIEQAILSGVWVPAFSSAISLPRYGSGTGAATAAQARRG